MDGKIYKVEKALKDAGVGEPDAPEPAMKPSARGGFEFYKPMRQTREQKQKSDAQFKAIMDKRRSEG